MREQKLKMLASIPVMAWQTEMAHDTFRKEPLPHSTPELANWTHEILLRSYDRLRLQGEVSLIAAIIRCVAMAEMEKDVRLERAQREKGLMELSWEEWWEAGARAPLHIRETRWGPVLEFELREFIIALDEARSGLRSAGHATALNDNSFVRSPFLHVSRSLAEVLR